LLWIGTKNIMEYGKITSCSTYVQLQTLNHKFQSPLLLVILDNQPFRFD